MPSLCVNGSVYHTYTCTCTHVITQYLFIAQMFPILVAPLPPSYFWFSCLSLASLSFAFLAIFNPLLLREQLYMDAYIHQVSCVREYTLSIKYNYFRIHSVH